MNEKKSKIEEVEEPITKYKITSKQKGIGENFDIDKAIAEGLTIEEARAEMHKRIRAWNWKK